MAKDPYRYFRIEAQELVEDLGQGLAQLEKGYDSEIVRRLLRHAHTLKGAARVVRRVEIGNLAHRFEDLLSQHRDGPDAIAVATMNDALQVLAQIRRDVAELDVPSRKIRVVTEDIVPQEGSESVRVRVRDLDDVLDSALAAAAGASSLEAVGRRLEEICSELRTLVEAKSDKTRITEDGERLVEELESLHRRLGERTERVVGELGEIRTIASELRLIPARVVIADIERAARDAAQTLDKLVEVHCEGAEIHIDAHVLAGLRTALLHVVRNSVAHGIETRSERERQGKPAVGRIEISLERLGHQVRIVCRDDGKGVDFDEVQRAAVVRGAISSEAARDMDAASLTALLLRGGLSTTHAVTEVSGRGVGLDAARHAIEALRGEITLRSTKGEETVVEMVVPISLAAVPALSLQVEGCSVLVPLGNVRQTLRLRRDDVVRGEQGQRIERDGEAIPFVRLDHLLAGSLTNPEVQSAVILEAGGRIAAVGVDRLGGVQSIVIRPIPAHAEAAAFVSGAVFDDEGVPQLVLAPAAVVETATSARRVVYESATAESPPLLVIDDSLTTRMLEQSILESAGYRVELATSGEEGLAKARQQRYGAFIVDVEMPGMNGFEFISAVRDDDRLSMTPSILVTSRADPTDKRRGKEVGARAYIVKSEFDQAELLEAIRRLVG